jgi:type IV secretory pathway TrbL component
MIPAWLWIPLSLFGWISGGAVALHLWPVAMIAMAAALLTWALMHTLAWRRTP